MLEHKEMKKIHIVNMEITTMFLLLLHPLLRNSEIPKLNYLQKSPHKMTLNTLKTLRKHQLMTHTIISTMTKRLW